MILELGEQKMVRSDIGQFDCASGEGVPEFMGNFWLREIEILGQVKAAVFHSSENGSRTNPTRPGNLSVI
jgi:hypothetical protein